jgi:hypothetical protein
MQGHEGIFFMALLFGRGISFNSGINNGNFQ